MEIGNIFTGHLSLSIYRERETYSIYIHNYIRIAENIQNRAGHIYKYIGIV